MMLPCVQEHAESSSHGAPTPFPPPAALRVEDADGAGGGGAAYGAAVGHQRRVLLAHAAVPARHQRHRRRPVQAPGAPARQDGLTDLKLRIRVIAGSRNGSRLVAVSADEAAVPARVLAVWYASGLMHQCVTPSCVNVDQRPNKRTGLMSFSW